MISWLAFFVFFGLKCGEAKQMPSISELEAFFSERQSNTVHLCNLHKEPDSWQYDDLLGRRE
jgi:hypothetical protein